MHIRYFYINLDTAFERNLHFFEQAVKEKIIGDCLRISAYDGTKLETYNYDKTLFKNAIYVLRTKHYSSIPKNITNPNFSNNIIGNQLSHMHILEKIVNENIEESVIFQDDVILCKNFKLHLEDVIKHKPDDADIIWLGFHAKNIFKDFQGVDLSKDHHFHYKDKINDYIGVINKNPCSLAYYITLNGATQILKRWKKFGFVYETDKEFTRVLKNYTSVKILCTGNHHLKSQIF